MKQYSDDFPELQNFSSDFLNVPSVKNSGF